MMDIVERLRLYVPSNLHFPHSKKDKTLLDAVTEIERLRGQVEKLEEEVYLLSSDLAYIHVKIGDKPDENS